MLEKIKHYFSNRKVTFVFSINSEELVNTIRKYYGQDFDSSRYLDRFFDLRMDIPKLDIEKYFELIGFNTSRSSNIQDLIIKEIINKFGFEMREISRYMKLIKVASYAQAHNNYLIDDTYRFINACITPVILGVKLYNTKMYYEMIDGKDCAVLIDVLSKFKSKNYIKMLLNNGETFEGDAGTGTKVKAEDKIKNVYNALFIEEYSVFHEKEIVGNLVFCEENKKEINEIINLLSLDSNYRN